jgi:hypothetical protein
MTFLPPILLLGPFFNGRCYQLCPGYLHRDEKLFLLGISIQIGVVREFFNVERRATKELREFTKILDSRQ